MDPATPKKYTTPAPASLAPTLGDLMSSLLGTRRDIPRIQTSHKAIAHGAVDLRLTNESSFCCSFSLPLLTRADPLNSRHQPSRLLSPLKDLRPAIWAREVLPEKRAKESIAYRRKNWRLNLKPRAPQTTGLGASRALVLGLFQYFAPQPFGTSLVVLSL